VTELELSVAIESALVARNPRQMQVAREALQPGYYLRAAQLLRQARGVVLIGTGFPVADTFETDGPVGAIALYDALEALGLEPWLATGAPMSEAIGDDYRLVRLQAQTLDEAHREAAQHIERLQPALVISIERPGLSQDGCYYNMRGEDITGRSNFFDPYLTLAACPTIAIGDGGNEIGMGNIGEAIATLDITPSATTCDELLVADVSNWGAYGLIALLAYWAQRDLLADIFPMRILNYLSERGSVDGVTRENTLTEDGMEASEGTSVIAELRRLTGFDSI
jgi:hypothetical protein